jgi:hypothetical protein
MRRAGREVTFTNGGAAGGGGGRPPQLTLRLTSPPHPRPTPRTPPTPPPPPPPSRPVGNPHALGARPKTFTREVLALCAAPWLLDDPALPFAPDARARARALLASFPGGVGAYSDSRGSPVVRGEVAAFIGARDGHPADPEARALGAGSGRGRGAFRARARGGIGPCQGCLPGPVCAPRAGLFPPNPKTAKPLAPRPFSSRTAPAPASACCCRRSSAAPATPCWCPCHRWGRNRQTKPPEPNGRGGQGYRSAAPCSCVFALPGGVTRCSLACPALRCLASKARLPGYVERPGLKNHGCCDSLTHCSPSHKPPPN